MDLMGHGTDHSEAAEWHRVEQAKTVAECWAIHSRLKLIDVDRDVIRTVVDGYRTTAYYRDGRRYIVEFICFPDTVDPRGAKGSR